MFKKLFLAALLVLSLVSIVPAQQIAYAANPPATGTAGGVDDLGGAGFKFDISIITHEQIDEQNWIRKGINFVFERIIGLMAATVGSAAVLVMSIGGFMIMTSGGQQEKYDKGKALITKALFGLVFVLGAYVLVTTVQILIRSIFNTG